MKTVLIREVAGDFAEDKDTAAEVREKFIRPELIARRRIVLDFSGVTLTTQSFIHALMSDVLRSVGEEALGYLEFRGCITGVRGIIETVVQYSLETIGGEDEDGEKEEPGDL